MPTVCESGNAAEQVRRYHGGGQGDWSLPSWDELNALYYYGGRNAIGGFAADKYWSSSDSGGGNSWDQDFADGTQHDGTQQKKETDAAQCGLSNYSSLRLFVLPCSMNR
jgi:hypothetical protein